MPSTEYMYDEVIEALINDHLESEYMARDRDTYRERNGDAYRTAIIRWLNRYTPSQLEDYRSTMGISSYAVSRRYDMTRLYGAGSSADGYSVYAGEYSGIKITKIITKETTGMPIADALVLIQNALPKWVIARPVKGGIRFSSTRDGVFVSMMGSLPKVRVEGRGADRFVGTFALNRALANAASFKANYIAKARAQMKAQSAVDTRPSKPVRSGGGDASAFYKRIHEQRKTEDKIVPMFAMARHGVLSSRQWGIEVETAGARGAERPAGWGKKEDCSLRSAYAPHDPNLHRERIYNNSQMRWTENPDYVDGEDCDECNGDNEEDTAEFVSPILHSYHSQGLEKLLDYLSTQPQNDSAGVHVHVDVADLNVKQIGSLVYGYSVLEPLLEASYQRTTRQYCHTRSHGENIEIGRSVKDLAKNGQITELTSIYEGDRYVTLNLCAIEAHGTVEFRAMGPVYDYEYLIKWAYICRELVNVAKAGVKPSEWNAVTSFAKLQQLFIRKGAESVDIALSEIDDTDITAMLKVNSYDYQYSSDFSRGLMVGARGEI